MREKTGTKPSDPRKEMAIKFYREGGSGFSAGNAFQSLIAAGYSRATAKSNCHLFRRAVDISVRRALELQGHGAHEQAELLLRLTSAKTTRWNSKAEDWDEFEDNHTQLGAVQEINRLRDEYPAPKEITGDNRPIQIIFPGNFSDLIPKNAPAGD